MVLSPPRGLERWGAFLVLLAALGLSGCAARTATVSGKVYYGDTLLTAGNVTFISSEGKPSVSTSIMEDGSYTLPKAPTGVVKVCVETESLNPASRGNAPKYSPPPGMKSPYSSAKRDDATRRYVAIPPQYAAPQTTDLTYEVKSGSQEYDIRLK